MVPPDCLITSEIDDSGTLVISFSFEGSAGDEFWIPLIEQGMIASFAFSIDVQHNLAESWNDWWLTDYAVGQNNRGIHRGFYDAVDIFIQHLKGDKDEKARIPIPEAARTRFDEKYLAIKSEKDNEGRKVEKLCVTWDGLINYAKKERGKVLFQITGHSLGGALAQVFTYRLVTDFGIDSGSVITYTFASPVPFTIGAISGSLYDDLNVYNYINVRDLVPKYGVTYTRNRLSSLFETVFINELSNGIQMALYQSGINEDALPGGFVNGGMNLGFNIYMEGDAKQGMINEHYIESYDDLLSSQATSYCTVDTRDYVYNENELQSAVDKLNQYGAGDRNINSD